MSEKRKPGVAKKTAHKGPITKVQNQKNWEGNYAGLVSACRSQLAFLVEKFDFVMDVDIRPGSAGIDFSGPRGVLSVRSDMCETPWMTAARPGEVSFGLQRAMAAIDPDYAKSAPKEDAGHAAAIAWYAGFLRKHLDDVLPR